MDGFSVLDREVKIILLSKLVLLSFLFLALFFPLYPQLFNKFTEADSYYSHGFLIPLICLYLVWRKKDQLKQLTAQGSSLGFLVLLGGLLLYLASLALKLNFGSYLAMVITLSGIVLFLGGKQFFKQLLFPIGFLLFMLPLPTVVIIAISFKLKLLIANLAAAIVNFLGIWANQVGSTIYLKESFIVVGDPCSGLRSLISFLALGVLFTQFTDASAIKKFLLVGFTIPLAVISNLIRIVLLLLVSQVYGQKAALGFFHDFSGMLVFILGFIGFIAVTKALKCKITAAI